MDVSAFDLLDTSGFVPRWQCGLWSAGLGWVTIGADLATWAAYTALPLVLVHFARQRPDVPFPGIFWLFGAFIFSCGTVHLVEAAMFWHPVYRLSAVVKVLTAIVSWLTVLALVPVVPRALALPGRARLSEALAEEVRERRDAEERFRQRAEEAERINAELERFQRVTVGREHRVLELKGEVNALLERLGEPPRYGAIAEEGAR